MMALLSDAPRWPKARQRELAQALGSSDPVLMRDLAVAWQRAALRGPTLPKERAADVRTQAEMQADVRRLARAARALARAATDLDAVQRPELRNWRDAWLGPMWAVELTNLRDWTRLLARWPVSRRGRGQPWSEARYLADDVADVLAWHGIPLTTYPDGRFGRVLDIVLRSLNLTADVGGLVRAVTKARGKSSK